MNTIWTILLAPLAAALTILTVTRRQPRLSALLSIGAITLSFALSLTTLVRFSHGELLSPAPFAWLDLGTLHLQAGAVIDSLSLLMLLVVTGVGTAIHVFSLGYMRGDPGYARYFGCLSLFTFSMLGVVLAPNFIQMFLFWELVGLSSYLLIGFWFERPAAAEAAKKALLTNRVGDFGFMLGILLVWSLAGSVDFATLQSRWPVAGMSPDMVTVAGLLIFCGAVGKSAQLPLHVWLPDAMEGPTPVSALIHAATMVAAGVYLMCRLVWLLTPDALSIVAWIGALTAIMAALLALTQNDLKRILAYSTLSQLGYMMMAVGLGQGATAPAMFHLTTHACFKALLFLAAGSVIHALHHEQDIWKMGGLIRRMPLTSVAFLIGTLALAGVWPLSGFYSKDAILLLALHRNPALFGIAAFTAFLTAFYMGRAGCIAFLGPARAGHHAVHETPPVMALPLVFLASLSVVVGWGNRIPAFLTPTAPAVDAHNPLLAAGLLAIPATGFLIAAWLYLRASPSDAPLRRLLGPLAGILDQRFGFDAFYGMLIRVVQGGLATACDWTDRMVIQRLGLGGLIAGVARTGRLVRGFQNGQVNFYAFIFGAGTVLLLYLVLFQC